MKRSILMNQKDDGVTALEDIKVGDFVGVYDENNTLIDKIEAKEDIPFGNKIAIRDKMKDDIVYKYGEPIGRATRNILKGYLIHVHNVKSLSVDIPPAFKKEIIRQMGIKEEYDNGIFRL